MATIYPEKPQLHMVWPFATGRACPQFSTADGYSIRRQHVAKGEEVDLVKFNQDYDANICERIAARNGMTFSTDPEHDTARTRCA